MYTPRDTRAMLPIYMYYYYHCIRISRICQLELYHVVRSTTVTVRLSFPSILLLLRIQSEITLDTCQHPDAATACDLERLRRPTCHGGR